MATLLYLAPAQFFCCSNCDGANKWQYASTWRYLACWFNRMWLHNIETQTGRELYNRKFYGCMHSLLYHAVSAGLTDGAWSTKFHSRKSLQIWITWILNLAILVFQWACAEVAACRGSVVTYWCKGVPPYGMCSKCGVVTWLSPWLHTKRWSCQEGTPGALYTAMLPWFLMAISHGNHIRTVFLTREQTSKAGGTFDSLLIA